MCRASPRDSKFRALWFTQAHPMAVGSTTVGRASLASRGGDVSALGLRKLRRAGREASHQVLDGPVATRPILLHIARQANALLLVLVSSTRSLLTPLAPAYNRPTRRNDLAG